MKEITYDLTYKWNLIHKTNKQAKYNQRCGNKEQTDSNQRGAGRDRHNRGKKRKVQAKKHQQRTHGNGQRGGLTVGVAGQGREERWRKGGTTVTEQK